MKERVVAAFLFAFGVWIGLAACCAPAHAEDAPILSMRRVSLATGVDHKWYQEGSRGFQVGVFGAYNVIPHGSIVASSVYDLNGKGLEHKVGIRIRIWQGRQ